MKTCRVCGEFKDMLNYSCNEYELNQPRCKDCLPSKRLNYKTLLKEEKKTPEEWTEEIEMIIKMQNNIRFMQWYEFKNLSLIN